MLQILISIAGIFLTIFFVIGIHESAHFFAARLLNIKVLRFSIGFGNPLYRWYDKKGTEYVLAPIPLGGYIKMLDETEEKVPPDQLHLAFNRQPFYKKLIVVLAGPIANIGSAFFLYWLIFILGFTTVIPIIGTVTPHSIAAEAGLKAQQEIVAIDNRSITTWTSASLRILVHAGNQDYLRIHTKNFSPLATTHETTDTSQNRVLDLSHWQMQGLTPDPLSSLGIIPYEPFIPLIIRKIEPRSPAIQSPLQLGDKIMAMNGEAIKSWLEVSKKILHSPEQTISFTIERQNKTLKVPVTIGSQRNLLWQKQGYLGIGTDFQWPQELLRKIQYPPLAAIPHAWQEMVDFTYLNLLIFGKMLLGKISLQGMGGPITIFETAGLALHYGLTPFLSFLAFLSISIGIVNLLPIPGLDGGHILIYCIELVIRRPLSLSVQFLLFRIGLAFLIVLLTQALVNDILRLY